MDKKKTGLLIKEARIKKQYTQSELGDLIGVTNKAVSRWENGESFPDIGVLEMLAQVLDLSIQDIVVGEINPHNNAVVEVVRIAKLQQRAKRAELLKFIAAMMMIFYVAYLGVYGLSAYGSLDYNWLVIYAVSFCVIAGLILWNAYSEKISFVIGQTRKDHAHFCVPLLSILLEMVILCGVFLAVGKKNMSFGIEPSVVGPTLTTILRILFAVNLMVVISIYRDALKKPNRMSIGVFGAFGILFLSGLNGELLYNLSTLEVVWQMLWTNIGVILTVMLMAVLVGVILNKKNKEAA